MKANRAGRDEAVSSVVGGLLVFGLLVTVMVTIQVSFVPTWDHDRESRHMTEVQGQFALLKGVAENQVANATAVGVSSPVTMHHPPSYRFFQSSSLPGTVAFEPGTGDVGFSAPEMLILESGGQSTAGASEDWTSVGGTQTIDDVGDVDHLRLRLRNVGSEAHGDGVTITVTDADGAFAGSLRAYIQVAHPDRIVMTQVRLANGDDVYHQGVSFHQVTGVDFWWIDALSPELQFQDILAVTKAPFTLTLVESGMQGDFTATYVDTGSGGAVGSSGRLVTNWTEELDSGSLRFTSGNSQMVPQTFIMQNGGVVLVQPDGVVMRIDPRLAVQASATHTSLRVTVPALTGAPDAITGGGTASVLLDGGTAIHLTGTAPSWSMQVTTEYGAVWADAWTRIFANAGLSQAAGHFTIATTAADARLTVYGHTTAPSSTVHDLSVEFHVASVDVRLQA